MTKEDHKGVLDALLDTPTPLKAVVLVPKNTFHRILIFLRVIKPKSQMLILNATTMRTNWKLTYLISDLAVDSKKDGEAERFLDILAINTFQMATIVATAIHNHNSKTPSWLINSIADSFNNKELHAATKEVYRRLDVQSFFGSMELLRTLSLLGNIPDLIPPGQPSDQ
ncbi:hypothetical protein [Pedobacter gandavensis]|uniref:Uncharacterized protein n=1 Tax=Pedobacter gandavensis TaxID=2679963 RepID=A0ABR6EU64_9SPHI|nr:hypothetical protein [Pedobacter gandavensis]MBB2148806.1 hypothetical protein [Pedobacter gandavensis]